MYKRTTLTSIPEQENEEASAKKWVPKKKHEVLKAKYKCLKKLFQIYDASVIGLLPEQRSESPRSDEEPKPDRNRRRKRSHRTKTDACAGTTETTSGDNNSEFENCSLTNAVFRELNADQSCISTQMTAKIDKFAETTDNYAENSVCNCQTACQKSCHHNCQTCVCQKERCFKEYQLLNNLHPPIPYVVERRKLTRLQCFVQRLFGIRGETYKPQEKLYTASDPILTYKEKRRRRGLRFRRIKRAKKVRSDSALRELKNPSILTYVQAVQRHCLMDTTPRKCPFVGCNMVFYGIINYNDHLNLCHFKDRKFVCHYCHEGFETEYDKLMHENEHIGITKLGTNVSILSSTGQTYKSGYVNQTEQELKIPEEKLKKIVSFFDKISDPEHILNEIKKTRSSEANLLVAVKDTVRSSSSSERSDSFQTRASSCCHIRRQTEHTLSSSERLDTHTCRYCGEVFNCSIDLKLHVESQHRERDRFFKYHNCGAHPRVDMMTEEGSINVQTASESLSCDGSVKRTGTSTTLGTVSRKSDSVSRKTDDTLICDPSTNIVYTSVESLTTKPSATGSLAQKIRSYRWEPGTKIIRV